MKIGIISFCFSLLLLQTTCAPLKDQADYKEKVEAELGKDTQAMESPEGKYTLFFSQEKSSETMELIKFMVVDNETEKLVFQDALSNARLSWHSDTHLLVEQRLGILQKDASENGIRRFLLDPSTGRKNPFSQNEKSH